MLLHFAVLVLAVHSVTATSEPFPVIDCSRISCDIPLCPNPVTRPGDCCPTCSPRPDCSAVLCARPNCDNPITPPGQCCPVCPTPPRPPINCALVRCDVSCPNPIPPAPGECCPKCLEDCRVILCLRPDCENPITPPGRCCLTCPASPPSTPIPPLNCELIQCDPPICPFELVPPGPGECCPSCPPNGTTILPPPTGPCPPGVPIVRCANAATACNEVSCPNFPRATCVFDNCGGCNAKFFVGRREVTSDCGPLVGPCPPGVPVTACLVNPCDVTSCTNFPNAQCVFDNCGGCNARFFVGRQEVTGQCGGGTSGNGACPVQGQVFQECRSCPATCAEPDIACAAVCIPGCGCPRDQLIDETNNKCVERDQCPGSAGGHSCPIEGQVFQRCRTCPATCKNPNILCILICQPGCGCPSGQLIDEDNNRCVPRDRCPPSSGCSTGPPRCPPLSCNDIIPPNDPCGCPTCRGETDTSKCFLPSETGPCRAFFLRYYYNSVTKRCQRFVYGGCRGNDNNFETLQECRDECANKLINKCSLPFDSGPCEAAITRFFFDGRTCSRFTYGGCLGNENNFRSRRECLRECGNNPGTNRCQLPRDPGPCRGAFPRYFYNTNTRRCQSFIYGGCQGNDNNFRSLSDCQRSCENGEGSSGNKCLLPQDSGPCLAAIRRFYYNSVTKRCERFIYGGCNGNENNFRSLAECRRECGSFIHPTPPPPTNRCLLPPDSGPCFAAFRRFYYNSRSRRCERFTYGGCLGNDNNFVTLQDCNRYCRSGGGIKNTPPVCSEDYCNGYPNRVCTVPLETPDTVAGRSHCDITVCRACYYAPYSLPNPRLHRSCPEVLPLLGGGNSKCGNSKQLRRWGYCIHKAFRRSSHYRIRQGSFRCFRPPYPYSG